jgi:hypothetical protein
VQALLKRSHCQGGWYKQGDLPGQLLHLNAGSLGKLNSYLFWMVTGKQASEMLIEGKQATEMIANPQVKTSWPSIHCAHYPYNVAKH